MAQEPSTEAAAVRLQENTAIGTGILSLTTTIRYSAPNKSVIV